MQSNHKMTLMLARDLKKRFIELFDKQ